MNEESGRLGPEHPLDGITGHGVEEEDQDGCQRCDYEQLEYDPFVVIPQDIADGFQGTQEPDKRGVGTIGFFQWVGFIPSQACLVFLGFLR